MDDAFTGTTPPEVTPTLDQLVGEGRKYKDPDAVAKALMEKDNFIEQLKRENAEAREALSKRTREEEFLDRLATATRPQVSVPTQDPPAPPEAKSALTPDVVEEIIERRELEKARKDNLDAVMSTLQGKFGDNYVTQVQTQARDLGYTTAELTAIAAQNPKAFYRLLGIEATARPSGSPPAFSPPPRTSVNTSADMATPSKKDYAYYRKMRDEKGDRWYFSIPVQQEIWEASKEALARGEKFLPD